MGNLLEGIKVSKQKSLHETIYQSLKKSILYGKLKPGQRLIEETLAHQVGISRTPIREAFYKLERDELVTRLPKGGFAVRKSTEKDVEEIFGIRGALEGYAAFLAALHITPEKLSVLEKKVDEAEKAMKRGDVEKAFKLQTEFHQILYKTCDSKKLFGMIDYFQDYFYRYRFAMLHTETGMGFTIEAYRSMIEAMKKKDPGSAEKIARDYMEKGKERILKEIREGRMDP